MKELDLKKIRKALKEFQTHSSRYRYLDFVLNKLSKRMFEQKSDKEKIKKLHKTFSKIAEMRNNFFKSALNEIRHDDEMRQIDEILTGRKLLQIRNAQKKYTKLFEQERTPNPLNGLEELAIEKKGSKNGKFYLKLAAEAYGRDGRFEDELRIHKMLRRMK